MTEVVFTAKQAAKDMWEYGEDQYVEKVLALTDDELMTLHELVGKHMDENTLRILGREDVTGHDLGLMTAVTVVAYFEGKVRPLARKRRRARSSMPKELRYSWEEELDKQIDFTSKRFPPGQE